MKKGKLLVIEGIDSCGKGTQLRMLSERLKKLGTDVLTQDFPRYYTSPWGKMAGEFLTGKFGKFGEIDPHLALFPYMIDQYTWSRDVGIPYLEKGGTIVLDRFFTSNVHQVAKNKGKARTAYRNWLWNLGFKDLGIRKPDAVLFLDISPKFTKKLLKTKSERDYLKGKKKDNAEKNWKHQEESYKEYIYMTKNYNYWKKVKCVSKGNLDTPEVIHERIWNIVSKVI